MVQVFALLFIIGLILLMVNFIWLSKSKTMLIWSWWRVVGYALVAVPSVFFTLISSAWFDSFNGYVCAVLVAFLTPAIEEFILLWVWSLCKSYKVVQ